MKYLFIILVLSFGSVSGSNSVLADDQQDHILDNGTYHDEVIELKENLEYLGFDSFEMTDYFDSQTEEAVEAFQAHFQLEENGIAGESTLAKLDEVVESPFQNGERHEGSIALKEQLTILGYTDFTNPNSFYGSGTERGVREFQSDHDLPESGIADERTRSLIQEKAEGPLRNPMYREDAVELKENLTLLGYTNFTSPNNFYGSGTEAGVLKLQRDYDLDESGVADEATLAKIEALVNSPFRNGERHEESIALKEQLTILGYTDFTNPNSFYGSGTERGVREFQSDHDLPESGIADERTRSLIQEKAEGPLRNPMYREDAVLLKEKLETAGFGSFAKTNYFGPQTEATVKAFQSYYGLTEDGIAGESTLAKLDEVIESPFQNGERHEESIALKEQLTILGYTDFTNPNSFYGSGTERGVREFQSDHDLPESGIADERTRSLIQEKAEGPLRNPMYREDAVELKENLTLLGYTNFTTPNNFYGSGTEAGVLKLQRDYDLDESGMADEATLAKIEALVNSPFRNGERHEGSVVLKEQLTILGYTDFTNPNSFYGSGTERGVREFQSDHDLPESGIADERTRSLIQEKAEGPLRNPMYREDAVLLKEKLETAGFGSFAKTNYFGPQTEATVKAFQSYYGLTEDGIAGESTLAKLDEVVESPFRNGETHDESVVLKEHLTRLGFSSFSNPNGFYGSRTTQAVEEFQGHFGLVVNGIADSPTWDKIEEILNSPYQEGESSSAIADYKDMLIDLGFGEGIRKGNPNFGSNTTKNVRDFQEEMGLPVSGILDEATVNILEKEYGNNVFRIFIDPGHGGRFVGGVGNGMKEKDLVLDISLSARDYLLDNYSGVDVKLSRTTDVELAEDLTEDLLERSKMANDWEADYFVSIHTNAFNGRAHGFESFIFNGNVSSATKRHQENIHSYLIDQMNVYDRGMKEANFNVLRNTTMPAILLEFLFIDHAEDAELLQSRSYRDWLGKITAEAIADSFGLKNNK
ncbi:N-acetylmuramoyl-L-alanine amidase [Pelagirhabdus alkalitolerans]|uniref:N-acetylmuramoyl-L-alanine amidase n=1 Tax=Pelagirhabdus alkalitolerans TaxID=1612202 RepID=A0A1G6GFS5_9BACI|nr:peptidoglycan-binding protein [Pelagirhabdus alkalitolerans]SDB80837.1 N-acetylmuramoyl-L-alanine amidase [Pelagirhabdus alkalitolerans]